MRAPAHTTAAQPTAAPAPITTAGQVSSVHAEWRPMRGGLPITAPWSISQPASSTVSS